ncbi:hypothetical protein QYE76_036444 [Lolium multiflorum]|uniref:F-box domain-containing protein n=1 Tax=Lolium multiflorum TaxID=4521 RepID=A0AAD8VPD2_LOLMU|nr:hypothetical protein QYE76_036444 [Lolium multiflorum]
MLPLLPDDVIAEILSWVPVKQACRFRCVSQRWRALISSQAFLAAHKTRTEPLLMCVTSSYSWPQVSSALRLMDVDGNVLKAIDMPGQWVFNYGFDGPLGFTTAFCVPDYKFIINMIDPATGNVMKTPKELNIRPYWNLGVGLAIPSRTYKAVGLLSEYAQQHCNVLTVQDGAKWRLVQSVPTPPLDTTGRNKTPPVTVNGVMHFLYKFVDEDYVFRFDLESEEWKTWIQGPTRSSADKVENKTKGMVKLDDALCIVQWSPLNTWLVWLLTDPAKGTWVKAYTVPVDLTFDLLTPLSVMCDGRKLLFYACNEPMTMPALHVYDPLTRTCTHLAKFPSNLVGNAGLCNLHLECFVSPKISIVSVQSV